MRPNSVTIDMLVTFRQLLWAIFSAVTLTACTGVATQNTQSVPFSIESAKQGGCLNKELDTCLAHLQTGFHFMPMQDVPGQIGRNEAVDVNGKRIAAINHLSVVGHLDGWPDSTQSVVIQYTTHRIVNDVGMSLPDDPALANTTAEYEKTGLYEAMVLLLGSECPTISSDAVYKFFQNTVKPKIVRNKKQIEIHDTSAETNYFMHTPAIPFCGKKFTYTNLNGYDTNYISATNDSGVFRRVEISFKP